MLEFAPLKPQPKEPVINDVLLRRIRNFYETSDIRDAKDAWLDYFDAAADVKIGPFQAARRRHQKDAVDDVGWCCQEEALGFQPGRRSGQDRPRPYHAEGGSEQDGSREA